MAAGPVTEQQHREVDPARVGLGPDRTVVDRVATALRYHGFHGVRGLGRRRGVALPRRAPPRRHGARPSGDRGPGVVRRIRSEFPGPLVCYSAGVDARIAALTQGADDMVPSPVSYRELALRVRAGARRSDVGEPDADDGSHVITSGPR